MQAREKGIKVGLFRPSVLWPFPDKEVREMGEQVRAVVVPELNLGQMAHEVEWAVAGQAAVHRVNRIDGEPISPFQILEKIEGVVKG